MDSTPSKISVIVANTTGALFLLMIIGLAIAVVATDKPKEK